MPPRRRLNLRGEVVKLYVSLPRNYLETFLVVQYVRDYTGESTRPLSVSRATTRRLRVLPLLMFLVTAGCDSTRSDSLEAYEVPFRPCPDSPNCVSSDASNESHYVAPFEVSAAEEEAWEMVVSAIQALPRTDIITSTGDYIHAQCRSRVFGFVDDLELELRRADGVIAVRSASRTGYSDLGVNRRRVEALRLRLQKTGVIR